jgi:hypothetical protein
MTPGLRFGVEGVGEQLELSAGDDGLAGGFCGIGFGRSAEALDGKDWGVGRDGWG